MISPALTLALISLQTVEVPTPITAPLRNAGVYHVATDTWTRGHSSANFGTLITAYDNTATNNVVYGPLPGIEVIDEGIVPLPDNPVNRGAFDGYEISAFEIAYCTSNVGGPAFLFRFYSNYDPCTDPVSGSLSGEVGSFNTTGIGLPGFVDGGSEISCWIVTLDLQDTDGTFCLLGDGADGISGGGTVDHFGWSFETSTDGDFMVIAGDPNLPPDSGSGLGTLDFFYQRNEDDSSNDGCFFFGGFGNGNPFASFFLRLEAGLEDCAPSIGDNYCSSNPNTTGSPALIRAHGNVAASEETLILLAEPVPDTSGQFFFGTLATDDPFGAGRRCVGGAVQRLAATTGVGGRMAQNAFFSSANPQSVVAIAAGTTLHFQAWFRDGGGFNLSDGLTITFQ